jgi:murein DD-endopeptidase MepM/ murein hydrolase activator NlpD
MVRPVHIVTPDRGLCVLAVMAGLALAQPAASRAVDAAPATAGTGIGNTADGAPYGATMAPLDEDTSEPVRISVSKAATGEGRPMYARRQAFGQSGSVVSFSTQRPRYAEHRLAGSSPPQSFSTPVLSTSLLGKEGAIAALPSFFPVAASAMTSGFGWRYHPILGIMRAHSGLDLAAPYGSPIQVTANGTVAYANWSGGYGLLVTVDHGGGIETRYGHLSRLAVTLGQHVQTGAILGFVGSTGLSTGPHVHYELRINGRAVDPRAIRSPR